MFLRKLLGVEFAFTTEFTDRELEEEWQNLISILAKENCLRVLDDMLLMGENVKFFSLLCNTVLPYVAAVNITCLVLSTVSLNIYV